MSTPETNPLFPAAEPGLAAPAIPPEPFAEYPEDLRAPWRWSDLLLFMLFGLCSYVVLSVILVAGFLINGVKLGQLQQPGPLTSLFVVCNTIMISAAVMAYLFLTTRIRFHSPFWRTLGWRPFGERIPRFVAYASCIAGGSIFAEVIALASAAVGKKGKLPIENFFQDRESTFLLMAMGILVAPLVEETIFRGYLYPLLARTLGIGAGVIVTGTLFGLFHAMQLWGGWGQIALLVLVGIVFTYVRAATRTVLASYLLHVSYNTFIFTALFFASNGFRHLPGAH
jgi:membrane protease YdiL (CAAX protease family)